MTKWALITGATAGIGRGTAEALARAGFSIILNGRRQDRLEAVAKSLPLEPHQIRLAPFSVTDHSAWVAWIQKNDDVLTDLEVLVNNAGLAKGVELVPEGQLSDWQTMIDTNVTGLMQVTRLLLPSMIKRGRGHIVNIGSVAGRWTYRGGAVYCATKAAVKAFSEGLRMDLLGTGLRVTNIEPGMVETEFSEVRLGSAEKAKAVYQGMRALKSEDIAESIRWAVTLPEHVNIQELVIFPTDQAAVGQVHRRS